jgi:hypothetical protein
VPVGVVFQNKHIYENLRLVLDFFYLHFGLRGTESGFEKHILYTQNYYKLGESYTVVKDLFLFSPLHTVSWFLSLDYRHVVIKIYQFTLIRTIK